MSSQLLLKTENINKSFGPTRALIDVSIEVYRGEVRGLIGENGSGKSTLSSIVAGVQPADSGKMYLNGQLYEPKTMVEAQKAGVGMVVQESGIVPGITVASNIFLGNLARFKKKGFFNQKAMNAAAREILTEIGCPEIDVSRMVDYLDFEEKKIVEIARAIYMDPDILIIDETTTALAERGRELLYKVIEQRRQKNKSVLFISHDLDEVKRVCNAVTVLRDGRFIDTFSGEDITIPRLRNNMVGRELTGSYYRSDKKCTYDEEVVLDIRNITTEDTVMNFSAQLHKGEILGIGGLTDCGMHEIGRVLFGIERPLTGEVILKENNTEIKNPNIAIANDIGYVSKDRDKEALILNGSIKDNIILPAIPLLEEGPLKYISNSAEKKLVKEMIEKMNIKCVSEEQDCDELSGGNKQKVVFAKWLGADSNVLILDCPTRGIDIGVKAYMYDLMYELKKQGKSILMISEELPELIGMSDRIMILKDGKKTAEFRREEEVTEQEIINYMI